MAQRGVPHGASALYLAPGISFLNEEEAVLDAMYKGWEAQQVGARNNQQKSANALLRIVERFQAFSNEFPWNWTAGQFDEWMMDLVSTKKLSTSTIRGYQNAIRSFCEYLCSDHYGWVEECEARFGTHPSQVCHDWNTIRHVAEYEGDPNRRALTREELQRMFDHADDLVGERLDSGRKGAPQLYRDATLMKVIYAWGLRANEAVNLNLSDFYRNPHAPEFGRFGVLQVRLGKGSAGSGPKRRSVVTTNEDGVKALDDYVTNVWPLVKAPGSDALWLSERGTRLRTRELRDRFAFYRDEIELEQSLTPHCLRHSYVTHMVEDGYDQRFVSEQVGHVFGSTTGIYTHVSNEFANTLVRSALDQMRSTRQRPEGSK